MDQGFEAPRMRHLVRQVARPQLRTDGYPVAVDHIFAVYTGDDTAPLYPVWVTVETVMADSASGPVLAALEAEARRRLHDMFAVRMEVGPGFA